MRIAMMVVFCGCTSDCNGAESAMNCLSSIARVTSDTVVNITESNASLVSSGTFLAVVKCCVMDLM